MANPERLTIVGGGSWGTTLAAMAAGAGRNVTLLVRDDETARRLRHDRRNARYLPELVLPDALAIDSDPAACASAAVIVLAVPTAAMRATGGALRPFVGDAVVVSAAKGLERGTLLRMSAVIEQALDGAAPVCALSGPNLAGEIASGKPAASVVAGVDPAAIATARGFLQRPEFRIYASRDLVGVEIGGSLKNVIAIAAGIADGFDVGDNAKAALLTRGLAEIARLGVALGADPLTFAGLAGLGDLVATCASPRSRNRTVGLGLARGERLDAIAAALGQVAEGIETTRAAVELGRRLGVEAPIAEQLHEVMFAGKPPAAAIAALLARDPTDEVQGLSRGANKAD
ncbi:MAG TPA: NAD(P)H-dependent glycerol-3-phosphate dehydrogenase [Thermomicrobiales bacterium]|nr:NAD(P)H-dependent glycerol-3-phosphate dehydrogenase [Thermomicrobiales bacterium]